MGTSWKRLLALEVSAFGFFGLFWGCFAVLLADLSGSLGLSPGPLGIALFVGAGASIASMGALGWTSDRLGRRAYLILASSAFGAGIAGLALAGSSYPALLATLVVLYSVSGLYDVGMNAVAVDVERLSGRCLMSYLHAAFSAGAMAGSLGAGALWQAGADYRLVYLAVLVPLAALVLAFAATRFPRPEADEAEGERPPGGGLPPPRLQRPRAGPVGGRSTATDPCCWWRRSPAWACWPRGRWSTGRASTCVTRWGWRPSSAGRGWRSSMGRRRWAASPSAGWSGARATAGRW